MIKSVCTLLDTLYSGGLFPPLYSRERTDCSSHLQRKFKLTFQSNIIISDCYFLSETNLSSKSVSMKLTWVLWRQFGLNHRQVLIGLLQRYSDISDVVIVDWGSGSRSSGPLLWGKVFLFSYKSTTLALKHIPNAYLKRF